MGNNIALVEQLIDLLNLWSNSKLSVAETDKLLDTYIHTQDKLSDLYQLKPKSKDPNQVILVTVDTERRNNSTRIWVLDTRSTATNNLQMILLQAKPIVRNQFLYIL